LFISKKLLINEITSKFASGAIPKSGKEAYLGGRFTLIRSQNVHDFKFSYSGLAHIDDNQTKKRFCRKLTTL
jgi:type I restriction enzyme S subunit